GKDLEGPPRPNPRAEKGRDQDQRRARHETERRPEDKTGAEDEKVDRVEPADADDDREPQRGVDRGDGREQRDRARVELPRAGLHREQGGQAGDHQRPGGGVVGQAAAGEGPREQRESRQRDDSDRDLFSHPVTPPSHTWTLRSASDSRSRSSCVARTTEAPWSRSRATNAVRAVLAPRSMPRVGSSRRTSRGRPASTAARAARWRSPLERSRG